MFSVIIPLFNKATYIEKAILSVLSQTCKEFEIIVVNDGSTDDSLKNLQFIIHNLQFSKPEQYSKIRVITQSNQGVSTARNNGVKIAKYEFIAFLDADDWWESTFLEEIKNLIEKFSDAGVYGSSYYKVKNKKNIPAKIGVEPGFESGLINYYKVYAKTLNMPLWTGATVVRKSVFESENGFKPELKLGEDFDLWIRIISKNQLVFLNKPLAYYNQDVELKNRAIGDKFYKPQEHMLFTDYSELNNNPEFRYLFERLAVYGLLPYYIAGKNSNEVNTILSGINWKQHEFKYFLKYRILPKLVVRLWMNFLKFGSQIKTQLITNN